jgi:hypothetical protein
MPPVRALTLEGKPRQPRWVVVAGTPGRAHLRHLVPVKITGANPSPGPAELASPPTRNRDRAPVRGSASDLSSRGGFPCA